MRHARLRAGKTSANETIGTRVGAGPCGQSISKPHAYFDAVTPALLGGLLTYALLGMVFAGEDVHPPALEHADAVVTTPHGSKPGASQETQSLLAYVVFSGGHDVLYSNALF